MNSTSCKHALSLLNCIIIKLNKPSLTQSKTAEMALA